jgi:hypothetical protein
MEYWGIRYTVRAGIEAAAVVHAPIRGGVDFIDGRLGTERRSRGWLGRMMCRACRFGFRTPPDINRYATGNRHEGDIAMSSSSSRLGIIRANNRGTTNKRSLRLCIQTCVLVLACFGVTSPSFARSSFDGDWSVVVITHAGTCAPSLRYPIAITNGIVTNAGGSPAAVTGRVAPTGAVRVTVQSGGSWASGSGHLSATRGSGVWRGQGTSGFCQGTWQAERRSYGAQVMERGAPIYSYAPGRSRQYYQGR